MWETRNNRTNALLSNVSFLTKIVKSLSKKEITATDSKFNILKSTLQLCEKDRYNLLTDNVVDWNNEPVSPSDHLLILYSVLNEKLGFPILKNTKYASFVQESLLIQYKQ